MAAGTYLAEIVAGHRARAAADPRTKAELEASVAEAPARRGFVAAVASSPVGGIAVVAEIKRRSPSKGALDLELDPAALAREYAAGGASGLSVLTDADFFGGSPTDLGVARAACDLPVLRKDFTVCEADVYDARAMGADAVLLIVAALHGDELARLHQLAIGLGLDALVEVHDEAELAEALAIGATLIGVNQRDLRTFAVDHDRARRLAAAIPDGVVAVAESGVRDGADAMRLAEAGYQAVLVGETLVRSKDKAAAVAALRGHPVAARRGAASSTAGGR